MLRARCATNVVRSQGKYETEAMSYESIDLHDSNTNDSFIYALSNKRAKSNLDSTLLWLCRLRHINKKCIEKLQLDRLLKSTNDESFDKCVSFLSGKMARKPFLHQVERAKALLGLIHTDVFGAFRTMSRQRASYFVTFTDDFSRYGYVYLLKHKHEVFENFKVFQKKVQCQLGKTIKALRFDRGGEFISQEFLDHLKDHGIIVHHTPPYTPQHNGLDVVDGLDGTERGYQRLGLGEMFCLFNQKDALVKKSRITQEASGRLEDLEIIQDEDKHPSENTSLHHDEDEKEIDESQRDVIPVRRSTRTRHALDRMCLYVDAEEHELESMMRYFSFRRHLDELHVTWAHLEKKRTRLRTNTKTLKDLCSHSQSLETASQAIHDAVTHQVTAVSINFDTVVNPHRLKTQN
ncbi:retrotransposon protein, putative, ty1-copia subclass [Tanacetum coccineum]